MTQTKEISKKSVPNAIHYGGDDVKKNQEYLYIKKHGYGYGYCSIKTTSVMNSMGFQGA